MAWLGIVLYLIAVTPLRAGLTLHWDDSSLRGSLGVLVWGVRIQGTIGLVTNAEGKKQLYIGRTLPPPGFVPAASPAPEAAGLLQWYRTVKRANRGRTLVKNAVKLDLLEADAAVPGFGAASTALFTGLARVAGGLIPGLRLRARPAWDGCGGIRLRCMISCRLGMLLAACALGTISFLMERKKEEKPWIIPSGA